MKIGILTQPLHTNYGGLLQAFALQKYLRDMGHEVLTVDYSRKSRAWLVPYRLARRCVAKFLLRRNVALFPKPNEFTPLLNTSNAFAFALRAFLQAQMF